MKNTMKRMLSLALALMMCLSVAVPVFAEDATCPGKDLEHKKANCSYTFIEEHKPTCEKQGYTTYLCTGCGKYFADDIKEAIGHCTWEVVTPSTCTEQGTKKCSVCGDEAELPLADHDYEWDKDITVCGKKGEIATGICKVCGAKTTKVLTEHAWGNIPTAILVEPRCVPEELAEGQKPEDFQGLAQYTCDNCGITKDVVIYALEHHSMEDVELVTPTCEDGGTQMKAEYANDVIVKDGKLYGQTCKVCGWQNWEDVAAEHTYKDTPDRVIEVTCTTWGYDFYGCTRCGHTKTDSYEPLNHKNATVDPAQSTGAICGTDGVDVYVCPDCGESWETPAPALEHSWIEGGSDATCQEPAKKWTECEYCHLKENVTSVGNPDTSKHVFEKVDADSKEPTCSSAGWDAYKCDVCGATKEEPLNALGHTFDADGDGVDELDGEILPLCGDDGKLVYQCDVCQFQRYEHGQTFDPSNPVHHGMGGQQGIVPDVEILKYFTEPTCTKSGEALYKCNTCTAKAAANAANGATIEVTFVATVEAKGHVDANGNPFEGVDYPTECGQTITVDEDFKCAACDFEIKAGTYTAKATDHNKIGTPVCGQTVTFTCDHTIIVVDADGNEVANAPKVICTWTETVDVVHDYEETYHHDNLCDGMAHHDGNCTLNANGTWTHVATCCYSESEGIYYGFTHYVCTICEGEYIDEYEYAPEHKMEEQYTAPTCTATGATYKKCVNVHVDRDGNETVCDHATSVQIIPATGHIDENGNRIYCYTLAEDGETMVPVKEDVLCYSACCCDDDTHKKDEKTGRCTVGHTIAWEELHAWVSTHVEGTCIHADYTLWVCTVCQLNGVEDGFEFGEHDYTGAWSTLGATPDFDSETPWYLQEGVIPNLEHDRWEVVYNATYLTAGTLGFKCWKHDNVQCKGTIEMPYTLTDLKLSINTDSGIVAGADIVNSGKLLVTIQASAYDVDLYSIDLNLYYDEDVLEYTGEYIVSDYLNDLIGESGVEVGAAVENNIGIYMANNGTVPTNVNMKQVENVDLVTLVFDVKADVNDATTGVSYTTLTILDDVSILKADGIEKVEPNLVDDEVEVTIQTLGNVTKGTIESSKKRVDDFDGRALVEVMLTPNADYEATADINKDGVIDLVDYAALAQYIAAGCTYEELCAK